ncbi:MAG: hypothetical protein KJ799_04935 [Bacteroidetes bacterium]|nr:hypothetical protein [Bacteroidota bacterium]MBU1677941.1 hypothetical protein [Bacteroidota bacterium]MBU2506052.1 hypothetical protein [Bacteroidota bacterium]
MSKNIEHIPDYKNYDIYALVDLHRRIDHKVNKHKINLIEEQIRIKLNIDPLTDLSNPIIQKKFDKMLLNDKPIIGPEKQELESLNVLTFVQMAMVLFMFIILIAFLNGKDSNILTVLGILFGSIIFLIEIYKGFAFDEIFSLLFGKTLTKRDNPIAIGIQQIAYFLLMAIIIIGLISNI